MKLIMKALLPILILSIALTGCGASADSSSLVLNKKGVITQTIVEEWDQEQYDKKELQDQIENQITEYGQKIELNSIKTKDGKITVKMTYQDLASYVDYNQVTLFQGTVSQCQASGYLLEGDFKDAKSEPVDRTQVLNIGDKCVVLVFQEPLSVKIPATASPKWPMELKARSFLISLARIAIKAPYTAVKRPNPRRSMPFLKATFGKISITQK